MRQNGSCWMDYKISSLPLDWSIQYASWYRERGKGRGSTRMKGLKWTICSWKQQTVDRHTSESSKAIWFLEKKNEMMTASEQKTSVWASLVPLVIVLFPLFSQNFRSTFLFPSLFYFSSFSSASIQRNENCPFQRKHGRVYWRNKRKNYASTADNSLNSLVNGFLVHIFIAFHQSFDVFSVKYSLIFGKKTTW